MSLADKTQYLSSISDELALRWPDNHTVNLVCYGHSVPSGYFATPYVDPFHAYPHLLHRALKERFPYAVINVIVSAVGGENAQQGAKRFEKEALGYSPSVMTIDYGLNDRTLTLDESDAAWRSMIEKALANGIRLILLTPSWDQTWFTPNEAWKKLEQHADQIRQLADEYGVGLADTFAAFQRYVSREGDLQDLLCHVNHPSRLGHELITREISSWFMAR